MSLTTYSELQTSIANFLDRTDLTSIIPDFITLCESELSRDLRHWRMEGRSTASSAEQYVTLPSDWLETIRAHLTGSGTTSLNLVSTKDMADMRARNDDSTGDPCYYCHTEGQIELFPSPANSVELELLYYQRVPALSVSNTSNWVLTYHPELYLYGALVHSAPYLKDDERIVVWKSLYDDALIKVQAEADKANSSGSGLKVKLRSIGV